MWRGGAAFPEFWGMRRMQCIIPSFSQLIGPEKYISEARKREANTKDCNWLNVSSNYNVVPE